MRKYLLLSLVCVASSLLSVLIYSQLISPNRVVWAEQGGEKRLTGLVDKLLDNRTNSSFRSSAPTDFIEAAEVATPAVVNIRALIQTGGNIWGGGAMTGSSGSGVVVSPDGYIVTNHHVVEKSNDIKVTLSDKRTYQAKLVGSDPSTDVAVLKIEELELPFLVFGNSDSVRVGEWVLAVGNPFNLESTVTAGIVSAKGRNINILSGAASIESFIQTDAAVNPGNSGGALIDLEGELVGINTAIMTTNGAFQGVGVAIPSARVKWITSELVEYGKVRRAKVGLRVERLTQTLADELKLPVRGGVLVTRITADGPAQKAGLEIDDVILEIAQQQVFTPEDFRGVVEQLPADKSYTVKLIRDSEHITLEITPVISDS